LSWPDNARDTGPAGLEAAGFQLSRLYNIVEQMAVRVAKAFENKSTTNPAGTRN